MDRSAFRICVLLWMCYSCVCLGSKEKDNVRIGIFFNEDQEDIRYWDLLKDNIDENVELVVSNDQVPDEIQRISTNDISATRKQFCQYIDDIKTERLLAILGPKSEVTSSLLEAICSYLDIPYILTTWRPKTNTLDKNTLNLYPDANILSMGMAKVIESLDWSDGLVLLYDNDLALIKLQDALKLQEFNQETLKNSIMMQKLEINEDYRIIIDCDVDRIMDILRQADEIDLLSDFSRSFFFTSLDTHTLDFSWLKKSQINITSVRLFDPFNVKFQKIAREYFPDVMPQQIRVETALIYDAVTLVTETVNQLKAKQVEFGVREIHCEAEEKYKDDLGLVAIMQQIELSDTLTGPISLQNGIRDKFILEVIEIDKPEKPIGIWNADEPEKIRLTRNQTERDAELQRRMESYKFIVTSRIVPPYLFESENKEAYGNARYYGYSMDLIKEIAKIMNISFEFKITKENKSPNLVMDLVERRADLGICDFTITPQRREVIDFSMPFMNLGIGILHKKNTIEENDNMYAFMRPISWKVWFYMWTFSITCSLTLFFVARLAPGEWENPKPWDPESKELENIWTVNNFLWLILGSITTQGCDILPKSVPARVVAASWWVFALIITSSYTANLAAFLTMQKKDVTIDSVQELASQSKVKYGLMSNGSTETFFATSNNSLYQKMWNTMKNERPSVFEKDNLPGVERVQNTKNGLYAYFMESTGIEYELERRCNLRKIGDLLDSKSYGIGMPLNADYRHAINSAVLHLSESGKLMELKTKWWKKERKGDPCSRDTEEQSDALNISNVGGVFMVLGVGIGLAYAIAIIQFLWNVRQLSVNEHMPFMEALKCEVKFACRILEKKKRAVPVPSEDSSSTRSISPDPEQLSIAKSIFGRAASLLDVNIQDPSLRYRSKERSSSKPGNNRLKVVM